MTPNAALRNAIFEAHATQREVAIKARLPETRLSAIIRGRADATPQERKRLAAALSLTVDELFPSEALTS